MVMRGKGLLKSFLEYIGLFIVIQLSLILGTTYVNGKVAFIIALIWMVITIPLYFISKKLAIFKYPYSVLNAVIAALAISAFYLLKTVQLYNVFLGICGFVIFMMISYTFITITNRKMEISLVNMILCIGGIAVSIYIWIKGSPSVGSYLLFSIVIYLCFFISVFLRRKQESDHLEIVNIASLLMLFGVFLIVLF